MSVYACELCGYEYLSEVGDPDNGIEEGTDFEDLPADWLRLPATCHHKNPRLMELAKEQP